MGCFTFEERSLRSHTNAAFRECTSGSLASFRASSSWYRALSEGKVVVVVKVVKVKRRFSPEIVFGAEGLQYSKRRCGNDIVTLSLINLHVSGSVIYSQATMTHQAGVTSLAFPLLEVIHSSLPFES